MCFFNIISSCFYQVKCISFINMATILAVYNGYYLKEKNYKKDVILYKVHLLFYRTRNFMGVPKENKRLRDTTVQSKTQLYPLKALLFLYLQTTHSTLEESHYMPYFSSSNKTSSLPQYLALPKSSKPLKHVHHNLMVKTQCRRQ